MTVREWFAFRSTNAREIRAYASATPSARGRRRRRPAPLVYLAAYQYCLEAALLLQETDLIGPGDSYRRTLAAAGEAADRIWDDVYQIRLQDFDEEICPFRDLDPS